MLGRGGGDVDGHICQGYSHLLTLDNAYVVIGSSAASNGLSSLLGALWLRYNLFQRRSVYT